MRGLDSLKGDGHPSRFFGSKLWKNPFGTMTPRY